MKITLGRLAAIAGSREEPGALGVLASVKGLSARIGFKVAKIVNAVNAELQPFNKTRNELVEKYGKEVEGKPGMKFIAPGGPGHDEAVELFETEVELNVEPVEIPPEFDGLEPMVLAELDGLVSVKE